MLRFEVILEKNRDMDIIVATTVKLQAVDWSTIQFWILLAKGHST